ncbi:MAG TPA: hypothetical protein PLL54_01300 [Dermatophilaceae bacterium]|nr:hypothetical protein [Dermatophilaceae bacterium]
MAPSTSSTEVVAPTPLEHPRKRWRVTVFVLVSVVLCGAPAALVGADASSAVTASQLASLYFGFLLSAAAIVFAVAFANDRHWPSIREIARFCHLAPWLLLGGLATVVSWYGSILDSGLLARIAASLWLLSTLVGTSSLYLIVKYSNVDVMNRAMAHRLLADLQEGRGTTALDRAIREALAQNDPLRIQDLCDQIHLVQVRRPQLEAGFEVALSFTRRVVYAALHGALDGPTAAHTIGQCLPGYVESWPREARAPEFLARRIRRLAPIYAEFENEARRQLEHADAPLADVLAVRHAAVAAHRALGLLFDPEPKRATGAEMDVALELTPDDALACYRALSVHDVPGSDSGVYAVFQHLTGQRFGGNFFQEAPILSDAIEASVHLPRERARATLEAIVAEQIIRCRSRMGGHGPHARFFASEARTHVIASLRIARSLGLFDDHRTALASWLSLTAGTVGAVSDREGVTPLSALHMSLGLGCSHALRLVDQGAAEVADFLASLPPGMGGAVARRLSHLADVSDQPWSTLTEDVIVHTRGSHGPVR